MIHEQSVRKIAIKAADVVKTMVDAQGGDELDCGRVVQLMLAGLLLTIANGDARAAAELSERVALLTQEQFADYARSEM